MTPGAGLILTMVYDLGTLGRGPLDKATYKLNTYEYKVMFSKGPKFLDEI